jgi:hypothetical protein
LGVCWAAIPKEKAMTSLAKFACAFVLAGGLAAPALAAQGDAGSGPTPGATSPKDAGAGPTQGAASKPGSMGESANQNGQSGMNAGQGATSGANMHIAQKLRDDLGKAGFTDITVLPSSFLVRAKDSAGNPVMMVINPDSMTTITEETQRSNSASNSNHMGGSGNSAGATPGPSSAGGAQPVTPGGATKP